MKKRNITFTTILLVLGCFSLSPTARALSPPPDGGYPNQTTAEGDGALFSLTTGLGNTDGEGNTATGRAAMGNGTTGSQNTATGWQALFSNKGDENTANGAFALYSNTTGGSNIALGNSAGFNLTTGDFNIDIGNAGVAGEANTIRIGTSGDQTRTFIAGISGTGVAGAAVKVNANGLLGVAPSSERFKAEIKPMDKASEAILALKPVTFRYKKEVDPKGTAQFGLVAEQVAKVNPALVDRDGKG